MKARLLAAVLCLAVPGTAFPQALTSLASVRVAYTTRKNTVKPEGALKAQIDALDAQIADAGRLGRSGELRRLYAKGLALLNGREWNDASEYAASIVIRTDHVVADSTKPFTARLEQIFLPAIELTHAVSVDVTLGPPPRPGAPAPDNGAARALGTFDGVGRDLRESPFPFEVDLRQVPDGTYELAARIHDGDRALARATLTIALRKGLDAEVARLEAAAAKAPEPLRAEILFPVDRMRNVNRGRLELRTFSPERDFAAAQAIASAPGSPFAGRTGDIRRHYTLDAAREILPYRMYVPTAYDGRKPFPLIVALHGLGGTEDAFFDSYAKALPPLAESHGYIVAAPLGYRVDGSYGWGLGDPPGDPATRRTQDLSEQDVMQVLQQVRQEYKIDPSRIYLLGHSMGAIGTWKIAAKFPDIWAAIAPISGTGQPDTLTRFSRIPEIVVHGDNDPTVNVAGSRGMVAKMKELGTEVQYIEVPGGVHSDVVAPNLAAVVDFFDRHRKSDSRPSTQRDHDARPLQGRER